MTGVTHGGIFISDDEIRWMEELDHQEREEEMSSWAIQNSAREILRPTKISLNGKSLYRNIYTQELCFDDGMQAR